MNPLYRLVSDPFGALVMLFALGSWIYVITCIRGIQKAIGELAGEIRSGRNELNEKTTLEQRGEILRRTGWAVSYLEEIDRKLSQVARNPAAIATQNLGVKPQGEQAASAGSKRLPR